MIISVVLWAFLLHIQEVLCSNHEIGCPIWGFLFYFSHPRQMPGQFSKLGHNHICPHYFQFSSSVLSFDTVYELLTASWNLKGKVHPITVMLNPFLAGNMAFCCLQRHLKWENVFNSAWQSQDRTPKKFWKLDSCLFIEILYVTNSFCKNVLKIVTP